MDAKKIRIILAYLYLASVVVIAIILLAKARG